MGMRPWSRNRWRKLCIQKDGHLWLRIPTDIMRAFHLHKGSSVYVFPAPPVEIPEDVTVFVRFEPGGLYGELARDADSVPEPEPTGG